MPFAGVHPGQSVRSELVSTLQWLLALHVTGAFFLLGGVVMSSVLLVLAYTAQRPSDVALYLGLSRFAVIFIVSGARLVHEADYAYLHVLRTPYSGMGNSAQDGE